MNFEFFEKALTLPELIESKMAELKRLRDLKFNISGADPSREFISGGPQVQCRFEEIIVRIDELERELKEDIKGYLNYLDELHGVIEKFEGKEQLFLRYKYLDRFSDEEIAIKLGYSKRHLYNIKLELCTKLHLLS